ncbi:MAG: hypothetical protein KJO07_23990 [Deltaproteobacteria bacterium]|nr:hypothetical protein [Deltaproteobacteria bacterium]
MSIAANAVAHFKARREELREIDVPEWEGSIWYRPVMTVRERAAIMEHYDAKRQTFDASVFVTALITRALDADGKPVFRSASRLQIETEFDPEVVERVVMQMGILGDGAATSEEDREKK